MENKYTNTEANNAAEKNESSRKSFEGKLRRILVETPMAVRFASSIINAVSVILEERCKEKLGRNITTPDRVDLVCEAIIDMFKDPVCPLNKDEFLRGVVAFMLTHQRKQAIEKQTGESNKKEESNG